MMGMDVHACHLKMKLMDMPECPSEDGNNPSNLKSMEKKTKRNTKKKESKQVSRVILVYIIQEIPL